jgi:exopolyphosphatase/guanosine-5'-triphosphate,3'-diphosphate pyrophosphatase
VGFDVAVGSSGTINAIAACASTATAAIPRASTTWCSRRSRCGARLILEALPAGACFRRARSAPTSSRAAGAARADLRRAAHHRDDCERVRCEGVLLDSVRSTRTARPITCPTSVAKGCSVLAQPERDRPRRALHRPCASCSTARIGSTGKHRGATFSSRRRAAQRGLFVSHSAHHKHSAYIIATPISSSGSPSDVDLMAQLACYHRRARRACGTGAPRRAGRSAPRACSRRRAARGIALDRSHNAGIGEAHCAACPGG